MARVIHTIGVTVVVALATATTTATAAQRGSLATPVVSAEYRSYVSFLQDRAWAEAAEGAARDAAVVQVAEPGSAWSAVSVGAAAAAAALAFAGGTIVLGRRAGGTALRPGPRGL
jgi:hypothetical protein